MRLWLGRETKPYNSARASDCMALSGLCSYIFVDTKHSVGPVLHNAYYPKCGVKSGSHRGQIVERSDHKVALHRTNALKSTWRRLQNRRFDSVFEAVFNSIRVAITTHLVWIQPFYSHSKILIHKFRLSSYFTQIHSKPGTGALTMHI